MPKVTFLSLAAACRCALGCSEVESSGTKFGKRLKEVQNMYLILILYRCIQFCLGLAREIPEVSDPNLVARRGEKGLRYMRSALMGRPTRDAFGRGDSSSVFSSELKFLAGWGKYVPPLFSGRVPSSRFVRKFMRNFMRKNSPVRGVFLSISSPNCFDWHPFFLRVPLASRR